MLDEPLLMISSDALAACMNIYNSKKENVDRICKVRGKLHLLLGGRLPGVNEVTNKKNCATYFVCSPFSLP